MKIVITIECDNNDFGETEYTAGEEAGRILDALGADLRENGPTECNDKRLYDNSGNCVGVVRVR